MAIDPRVRRIAIERADASGRRDIDEHVVVEAPLVLRARGAPVATIMRTPGHDLALVRGLLHAEGIAGGEGCWQDEPDTVDIDVPASAFASRGLLSTAACGVCGRTAIADLELRAREVTADATVARAAIAAMPDTLRTAQELFASTGGLHAAALFTPAGELVCAREDVGRHNAVDKLVGWGLAAAIDPSAHVLFLSGRIGYELVQKAVMFGVPIVAAVSAPSSLAIDLAERFRIGLIGFVRGDRMNIYAHAWRVTDPP